MTRERTATALLALLLIGCRPTGEADPLQLGTERGAPASALAPGADSVGLDGQLARLEAELRAAADEDGDRFATRLRRAEAITDRLLEDELPVVWLPGEYFVEARLRQLQVRADRIVAGLQRGASAGDLRDEVDTFLSAVTRVRADIRGGGSPEAPPPLDSLLADSAAYARAPGVWDTVRAAAGTGAPATGAPTPGAPARTGPRLLGTPVDTSRN
ncbi:MAG TPA: hypothetical protein VMK65_05705 [Longimicrobiales bacterium]|nr:hypothetical protein [Longimicrobiales bacterium]